jgi:hypothetical protein
MIWSTHLLATISCTQLGGKAGCNDPICERATVIQLSEPAPPRRANNGPSNFIIEK